MSILFQSTIFIINTTTCVLTRYLKKMLYAWKFFIFLDTFSCFNTPWYWHNNSVLSNLLHNLLNNIESKFIWKWNNSTTGSSQSNFSSKNNSVCYQNIVRWVFLIVNKSSRIIITLLLTILFIKLSQLAIVWSTSMISIIVFLFKARVRTNTIFALVKKYLISSKKNFH